MSLPSWIGQMMYGYNGYLYGNTVKSKVPEPDDRVPPHLRPAPLLANPWSRSPSGLTADILFIAEFSEIDGPKPVVIYPSSGFGSFDVNQYTVKAMAVDYHSNHSVESFSLSSDVHMILTDHAQQVYTLVYSFTLYDINARGFVRPFCIVYATSDHKKLLLIYEELVDRLASFVSQLVSGNKDLFSVSLQQRLMDLFHSKDVYIAEGEDESSACLLGLEKALKDVEDALKCMEPSMNARRLDLQEQLVKPSLLEKSFLITKKMGTELTPLQELTKNFDCVSQSLVDVRNLFSRDYMVLTKELCDLQFIAPEATAVHIGSAITANLMLGRSRAPCGLEELTGETSIESDASSSIETCHSAFSTLDHDEKHQSTATTPSVGQSEPGFSLPPSYRSRASSEGTERPDSLRSSVRPCHPAARKHSSSLGPSANAILDEHRLFTESTESAASSSPGRCDSTYGSVHSFRKGMLLSRNDPELGTKLKTALQRYHSLFHHLVYTVLIGRPLIIIPNLKASDPYSDLEEVLSVCSLFSPFPHPLVHREKITLADIVKYPLIGYVCKGRDWLKEDSLSPAVKPLTSTFNLHTKQLVAPPYKGQWLNLFTKKHLRKLPPRVLLARVESLLLDISMKGYFYYQDVILGYKPGQVPIQGEQLFQAKADAHFKEAGIGRHDRTIVEYLTENVQVEQSLENVQRLSSSEILSPPARRIDGNTKCGTFKG